MQYPKVQMNTFGSRQRVVLYEDYIALETGSVLGVYEPKAEIYFDQIHYIFRYRARDWPMMSHIVLSVLAFLLGLIVAQIPEDLWRTSGRIVMGFMGGWGLYALYRLVAVPRNMFRIVAPTGAIDFRADRPRSRNPNRDARAFAQSLFQKVRIIEGFELQPRPNPENPPPTQP